MKVTVIAKNMELTDALKEIVQKKISKLEKYFEKNVEAKATLSVQKSRQIIEVTIPFNKVVTLLIVLMYKIKTTVNRGFNPHSISQSLEISSKLLGVL